MLRERLREIAGAEGCVGFGVTTADPFVGVAEEMEARKAAGLADHLGFTYRDPVAASDVRRSFPWAERIVSVACAYEPDAGAAMTKPSTLKIARFAESDHYLGLRSSLTAVARELHDLGYRAEVLADDSRLVDRAAAVRSGVGWWGKSTMVLVPGPGPWTLLGSVVTEAPVETTSPMKRSCGSCVACIPACPTSAISGDGALDARRCLAHLLQAPGVIPPEFREAIGDRLYGCDDCLTSCPPGRRVLAAARPKVGPEIKGILGATDRELLTRYDHFYIPGRRPRYLRRNALVAAGNDGSAELVPVVVGYLGHPDWLLRAHAAWAAGRFDTPTSRAALGQALEDERDGRVRGEIRAAAGREPPRLGLR